MRLLGRLTHLFDRDRIEIGEKGFARLAHGRIDHPLELRRDLPDQRCSAHRGAHDLAHRDVRSCSTLFLASRHNLFLLRGHDV
jgi:hypothetical protein